MASKIARLWMPVLAITMAATACGSSSANTSGASTPASSHTHAALTAAQARQLAAAAILRRSDLPGYAAKPESHTAQDVSDENSGRACLGLPTPVHYLARNFGIGFSKGATEVDSSADVAVSVTQARRELRALTSPKETRCFKRQIGPALASNGLSVKSFSTTLTHAVVPGADGVFAYRFAIKAAASGRQLNLEGYEVGALVGQVEIDVTVTGVPPLSVTFKQAQRLTAVAASRVKTAEPAP